MGFQAEKLSYFFFDAEAPFFAEPELFPFEDAELRFDERELLDEPAFLVPDDADLPPFLAALFEAAAPDAREPPSFELFPRPDAFLPAALGVAFFLGELAPDGRDADPPGGDSLDPFISRPPTNTV